MYVCTFTSQETAVLQKGGVNPQCLHGHGLTIHSQILRPKNPPLFVGGKLFSYPSPQIPGDSESGILASHPGTYDSKGLNEELAQSDTGLVSIGGQIF